jgi:hypothetical protein
MNIKSKTASNGDTIYFFTRAIKPPVFIVVSKDAPQEAHQYAKESLLDEYKRTTIKYKIKRTLCNFGAFLIEKTSN